MEAFTLLGMSPEASGFIKEYQFIIAVVILPLLYFIGGRLPAILWRWFKNTFFIELDFNNTYGMGLGAVPYNNFMVNVEKHRLTKLSRRAIVSNSGGRNDEPVTVAGKGLHFYKIGKVVFIGILSSETVQGRDIPIHTLKIFIFRKYIRDFNTVFESHLFDSPMNNGIPFSTAKGGDRSFRMLPLDTCEFIAEREPLHDSEVEQQLYDLIVRVRDDKNHYRQNGLPHKETLLFYGPPGTGKSSLIMRAVARTRSGITVTDIETLPKVIRDNVRRGSGMVNVILVEDIEHTPDILLPEYQPENYVNKLNLSEIWNALSGIEILEQMVIIFTTNNVSKIHNGFYRTGRIDECICVPYHTRDSGISKLLRLSEELRDYIYTHEKFVNISVGMLSKLLSVKSKADVDKVLAGVSLSHTLRTDINENTSTDVVKE